MSKNDWRRLAREREKEAQMWKYMYESVLSENMVGTQRRSEEPGEGNDEPWMGIIGNRVISQEEVDATWIKTRGFKEVVIDVHQNGHKGNKTADEASLDGV